MKKFCSWKQPSFFGVFWGRCLAFLFRFSRFLNLILSNISYLIWCYCSLFSRNELVSSNKWKSWNNEEEASMSTESLFIFQSTVSLVWHKRRILRNKCLQRYKIESNFVYITNISRRKSQWTNKIQVLSRYVVLISGSQCFWFAAHLLAYCFNCIV